MNSVIPIIEILFLIKVNLIVFFGLIIILVFSFSLIAFSRLYILATLFPELNKIERMSDGIFFKYLILGDLLMIELYRIKYIRYYYYF